MELLEFGNQIKDAVDNLFHRPITNAGVKSLIDEIVRALLGADVNILQVQTLRNTLQKRLQLENIAAGISKERLVRKILIEELTSLLNPGKPSFKPIRKETNVILFVGLQGCGKTTTTGKLALRYQQRGWKVGVVCADTFRAGAQEQTAQNCRRIKVPFFISWNEPDPVKAARDGVTHFTKKQFEIIIVDSSGRHKQEGELLDEMKQITDAINPNEIIFVMDGSIGQAAKDQAEAFSKSVKIGSIIVTKLDGNAKGGGAISAVASAKSPITFIGTGEHMHQLEEFNALRFVRKMLGLGDLEGVAEIIPKKSGKSVFDGTFNLRSLYDLFIEMMEMGSLELILESIPGLSSSLLKQNRSGNMREVVRGFLVIMDSMTDEELDSSTPFADKKTRESRFERISRGSGRTVQEVKALYSQFTVFSSVRSHRGQNRRGTKNIDMAKMLPPHLLKTFNNFCKHG